MAESNNQLYREKSITKLNSPESLNETIKAVTPSIWLIMGVVIIFLVTMLFWAIFGTIYTTVNFPVVSSQGEVYCYINEDKENIINELEGIIVGDVEYPLGKSNGIPIRLDEGNEIDAYILHRMNDLSSGWFYKVPVEGSLDEGIYEGTAKLNSIKPISFVID